MPELSLTIQSIAPLASDVRGLTLQRPDQGVLPDWEPGAHVDLVLPGGLVRQYSLCGDPRDKSAYRLAVLREPAGRGGSVALHDHLRANDRLLVRGPRNHFPLAAAHRYLFIAGGIGITPILPMLQAAAAARAQWTCLYGGRSRQSMAFLEELARWGPQVRVRPQDECGLLDVAGFIGAPRADTLIYCCGPAPLLSAVRQACAAAAWPSDQLRTESFGIAPADCPPGCDTAFSVVLARSGRTITVEAGQSILDALEAAGIQVSSSCGTGVCGTCETPVLDGVPDHRDCLLSEEEKQASRHMMICVSRAKSASVTLDL